MTEAEAVARASYPAPSDIVQGALAVFRDHLLERDQIAPDLMTAGALRYFVQHYQPQMAAQQIRTGIPGSADGWGGYSVTAVNAAMAAYDREQRPTGNPPSPGQPPSVPGALHIDGTTFRNADGTIWKYRMVTAFTAFQDFLAGRDLDGYAKWTRSVGGNGWRVFYTWAVTNFNPLALLGPTGLARELQNFRRYMDAQGLYGHHVAFCDQIDGSTVQMSDIDQNVHLEALRQAMQGRLVEAVNEDWKNGELSGRFSPAQFAGTFGTRSSWPDGNYPDSAGSILDWTTEHTPRDAEWPRKAKNLLETSVQGIGTFAPTRKPAVAGEPIGIFEQSVPGSRTADTSDVADYFAVAELFGAGACLHGDGGTLQRCQVPGPIAQRCAEWAHSARLAIPADAQLGSYTRGGLDDCPLEHDDAVALRTFAMISGNQATAVVVRPQPSWQPRARNGWAIQTISGPNGHIIGLTR